MSKNIFYFLLIIFLFSCEKEKPPMNVVVLFTDDQRFNTIHAWGNKEIHTPNMDKLVKMGTSFTHAHIMGSHHGGVCAPSRAMLLSGKPYMNIPRAYIDMGVTTPDTHFDFVTFPELLREKGYDTFFTGKWHNNTSKIREGFSDGENIFIGGMHWPKNGGHRKPQLWHFDSTAVFDKKNKWQAEKFSSEMFSDAAINFIQKQDDEKPFCLYVAYSSPHDPREAPEEFTQMYDFNNITLPKNFQPEHSFDNGHLRTRDENLAAFPRTEEMIKKELVAYYAMVSEVDAQIGRVLDVLEQKNLMENTVIVFAGDNGLAVGQHGLLGKQSVYDHSVRVPLVIAAPNIDGGKKTKALCYLYDVFPTICDLLGLEIPSSVEGESLFPILKNKEKEHRDHLFLAHAKEMRAVRTDDNWKLINYFVKGEMREQLFNLNQDEWELNNLANDSNFSKKKKKLASLLAQNIQDNNDDFIQAHIKLTQNNFDTPVEVFMSSSFPNTDIRYTLDGSEPTLKSPLFKKSFSLKTSHPIRAALFLDDKKFGKIYSAEAKISSHINYLDLIPLPSQKYAGNGKITLLDGANGSDDFHSGNWLGYESENVIAILQLKKIQPIQEVGVRFLSHPGSWIFSPKTIKILASEYGKDYNEIAQVNYLNAPTNKGFEVIEFKKKIKDSKAQFIKFEIENQGKCPDWHPGKGGKAWLFLDELIVN
ncbi:MAG: sulfatase-like hydrolase/transferase [Saprospiraceae bacterium]